MLKINVKLLTSVLLTSLLVACGAGGKSSTPTPVTPVTPAPPAPVVGSGLTLSPAYNGLTTLPNSAPIVAGTQWLYMSGTNNFTVTYLPANAATPSSLMIVFSQGGNVTQLNAPRNGSAGNICMDGTNASGFPLCSSLGIVFNKTAGTISFTNTPMSVAGSTAANLPTLYSLSGSLTFPPF